MTGRFMCASGLSLMTVACGSGTVAPAEPVAGMPPAHQRQISRAELPDDWPFVPGTGTLACDGGAVAFRAQGVTYALNDGARARGYADVNPIVVTQSAAPSNPLRRIPQDDRMRIFIASSACAARPEPSVCRRDLASARQLTADELIQIDAEGRERAWPPLTPSTRSVKPVLDAGLALCGR
jgi:uncharacterized protein DUF2511